MKNENIIQESELKNVNGGTGDIIYCDVCKKPFSRDGCKKQKVVNICKKYYVYRCPNCKTWFDGNGNRA